MCGARFRLDFLNAEGIRLKHTTAIEWTWVPGYQGETWNPVVGCSIVSPGCTNCYAMTFAGRRLDGNKAAPHYLGTTQPSKAGPVWSGKVALATHKLAEPLKAKKPRCYFVNSMGDLFHESVPDAWIDQVFAVMGRAKQHIFIVLTKRSNRMQQYMNELKRSGRWLDWKWSDTGTHIWDAAVAQFDRVFESIWLGVSAERQQEADERIPHLLGTPAAVRLVSIEPMLGPVSLNRIHVPDYGYLNALDDGYFTDGRPPRRRLDWVIVGGESGANARPMHPCWARQIRDQCAAAGVPFFMKQMDKREPIPVDLLTREWPNAA